MNMTRPKTDLELMQEAVFNHPGGPAEVAEELGKSPGTLYNELNPNNENNKLGWLDGKRIIRLTGDAGPLRKLCLDLGFVAVPIPASGPEADRDWFARLARLSKEYGDHVAAQGEALADGRLDRREARVVARELDELIEAAVADREALRRFLNER